MSEVLTKLKAACRSDRHSQWLMMDFDAAGKIVRYIDDISQVRFAIFSFIVHYFNIRDNIFFVQNIQGKRDAKIFSDLQQQQVVLPYGESGRGINNLKPSSSNPSNQYHNPPGSGEYFD